MVRPVDASRLTTPSSPAQGERMREALEKISGRHGRYVHCAADAEEIALAALNTADNGAAGEDGLGPHARQIEGDFAPIEYLVGGCIYLRQTGEQIVMDRAMADQLAAALSAPVPQSGAGDMVLVPREPTEAMLAVFHDRIRIECWPGKRVASVLNDRELWGLMLDAALTPSEHGSKDTNA